MAVQKAIPPKPTKQKRAPIVGPLTDEAALRERFKDYPAIDVISRRFNNPNDPGSLPILLRDEDENCCVNSDHQWELKAGATKCHTCKKPARKWYVRFTNTSIEGRWATIRAKGYVPVEQSDLMSEQDVADLVKHPGDNYVRRGDRGQEIMVKMPLELRNYVKAKFLASVNARAVSRTHMEASLANAAGDELGDEAGQTIHDGGIRVESFKRDRTTLGEEDAAD